MKYIYVVNDSKDEKVSLTLDKAIDSIEHMEGLCLVIEPDAINNADALLSLWTKAREHNVGLYVKGTAIDSYANGNVGNILSALCDIMKRGNKPEASAEDVEDVSENSISAKSRLMRKFNHSLYARTYNRWKSKAISKAHFAKVMGCSMSTLNKSIECYERDGKLPTRNAKKISTAKTKKETVTV